MTKTSRFKKEIGLDKIKRIKLTENDALVMHLDCTGLSHEQAKLKIGQVHQALHSCNFNHPVFIMPYHDTSNKSWVEKKPMSELPPGAKDLKPHELADTKTGNPVNEMNKEELDELEKTLVKGKTLEDLKKELATLENPTPKEIAAFQYALTKKSIEEEAAAKSQAEVIPFPTVSKAGQDGAGTVEPPKKSSINKPNIIGEKEEIPEITGTLNLDFSKVGKKE